MIKQPGERVASDIQENISMKNSYLVLILAAGLIFSACNKKAPEGMVAEVKGAKYDKATFDYVFTEGLRQKLLGNMADALNDFEQCIKLNPESDASNYEIAQILLANGDLETGKKYLVKASVIDPGNMWYGLALANVYYQQKNIDSAILCYEKLVKVYPEKENLEVSLANLYAEGKKYNEARNILTRLDEKYGVNETSTLALVKVLVEEKKYREALEKVRELLKQNPDDVTFNGIEAEIYRKQGDNEKASELYSELIKRNPEDGQIQLALCDFLLSQKDYDEVFSLLNTVVLNNQITREQKIALYSELMDNPDIQKDYGNKMEVALMVLNANYQDDNIIILMLPDFLQKEHKDMEAARQLEAVIKAEPENYFAWEKLLLVYFEMKDFTQLEASAKECATKFNMSILAKILYANAAMENKEFNVALEELRKAEILAGENKDQKLQVLTMRADVYYRMKEYTRSFETFDQALAVNDTDITVLNNYAYYLAEQNSRLKDAEKMSKEVVSRSKDNPTFLDTYAWILYKRGRERDAARIMEKILDQGRSEDAEYFEHYGFMLKKIGKCGEAVKAWERAIKLDNTKSYLGKEIEGCKK